MNQARGDDRGSVGRAGDGLGADQGLKVDGLARGAGDAEGLLELLPVAGIGQKKAGRLRALLLQSLQDKNAAASVG